MGDETTVTGKLTGGPRTTGPDDARRATPRQEARQRGTRPVTTKAHGEVPRNNGPGVPQPREVDNKRCHAISNPHTTILSQDWRGAGGARTQSTTPRTQRKPKPKNTHHKPQTGLAGRSQNPFPNKHTLDCSQDWRGYRETQTQTEAPDNSRKPNVHSPDTEAARAMQATWPKEIRRPGVRRRSVQHQSTLEPQSQDHAAGMPWEGDTPGSPVNPQRSAQRRGRVQAQEHTLLA